MRNHGAGADPLMCKSSEVFCAPDGGAAPYCADLATDVVNCGCCGNACGLRQGCINGRCDDTTHFGFFVLGDMHAGPPVNVETVRIAMNQMHQIDPNAFAAFSNGDMVDSPSGAQWAAHDSLVSSVNFHGDFTCAKSFGAETRYFATVGDHDVGVGNWLTFWDQHLAGQQPLGNHGTDGVYFSLKFANALFVLLDSEHVSADQTSWQDEQTGWLQSVLAGSDAQQAQLKFMFLHQAVYSCSGHHAPFVAALPWVDLAEQYGVNVVFGSHTHVYTRTCPKRHASCVDDGTGVVFVETGPIGGNPREVDGTTITAIGTDAAGNTRSDPYECVIGHDLMASSGGQNDFCHVGVDGCQAIVNCYVVAEGNTAAFDSWTVNGCRN